MSHTVQIEYWSRGRIVLQLQDMLAMSVASGGKTRTCDVRQCHLTTPTAYALLDEGTYRATLRNQKRLWQACAYFFIRCTNNPQYVKITCYTTSLHSFIPKIAVQNLPQTGWPFAHHWQHWTVGHSTVVLVHSSYLVLNKTLQTDAHVLIIVCVYSCCCWRRGMAICWY